MNPTGLNVTPSTSTFVTSGAVLLLAQACRWRAPDATVALADHAVRLARSENRVENALLAEGWLAHGLVVIGHGATAAPRAASALAEATRVGATAAAGRLRVELATIARTVDATDQAQRLLDPVLASSEVEPLLKADACLEAAMGTRREPSEARELLGLAVRALDHLGGEEGELGLAHVDALAASRARAEGRLTESVKRARDGLTRSLGNSMTGGQLEPVSPHLTTLLCYELCQALVANGHPEPVPEIARPILGWAVRPGSLVPAARLHLLLASAVQRPAGAFEDALASAMWVAEAIESRDLPELEAQCQTVLGEIWDGSGNLSEAVRATRQAHLAHRAHSERTNQLRALLIQVAGGSLAPPPSARQETGRAAKPADPRTLGRRAARTHAEDDAPGATGPSGGPSGGLDPSRLPGRPLNPRRDEGRNGEPRHGKPANGHRAANGFDSAPEADDVRRAAPEGIGDLRSNSRSSGADLPSGPVDPAFSNEFAASIRQFGGADTTPPADSGPPTLPGRRSSPPKTTFEIEPELVAGPRAGRGRPPSGHHEPDSQQRRDAATTPPPQGRRRRPVADEDSLGSPGDTIPEPAGFEAPADEDLPGVLWLSPDTPKAEPVATVRPRTSLTEQELATQLSDLVDRGEARPAHLVVIDISLPDGARCGPAARTVAERVADQLDEQRPPGARVNLLGEDTVTVSLTDPDQQSVNRWLRTVSGGISRRWATLAGELPSGATFRIVVRPLDARWSMIEHLTEVRGRLHPESAGDQARGASLPRPGQIAPAGSAPEVSAPETSAPEIGSPKYISPELGAPGGGGPGLGAPDAGGPGLGAPGGGGPGSGAPDAGEPEALGHGGRHGGPDSVDRDDSSSWDRALQGDDPADTGNHEPGPRSRHSVGGAQESEEFPGGQRQWLTAAPGSGGRRRRPESGPDLADGAEKRHSLTDPKPLGMSSASAQRPASRRDSAAIADHAHPDGWPTDDESVSSAGTGRPHGSGDRHVDHDRTPDGPTELTALGAPSEVGGRRRSPEIPGSVAPPESTESDGPGTAEREHSEPARGDDGSKPAETNTGFDAGTDATRGEERKKRGRGEISTLAMESVAPPGSGRDADSEGAGPTPEPEKPPARNWDRPVSELSFAELIDGALAAYREA